MTDEETLGAFEEQVMLAVIHARDEAFGMNVRREIEARTDREVAVGAVYATLDRLEAKKFIASSRPRTPGLSRRLFRVTSAGARVLAATHSLRDKMWRGIDPLRLAAGVR